MIKRDAYNILSKVIIRKCNHSFHPKCLFMKLRNKHACKQCPICKTHIELEDIIIRSESERLERLFKTRFEILWIDYLCELRQKENCAICLESMIDSDCSIITKCGHMYHTMCIWLSYMDSKKCPMCRKIIIGRDIKDLNLRLKYI
ncbi:uncharacterized protein LOC113387917 [Ctenocephalides felis]|uniref:uncharacterized protein LOC113387917 n=1 Tax=Ctenocephalides felis TaxID=7515 RepID=UPI000E6E1C9C|nr:uncharacterized protein LOC113387917 [Ctenocephalides felis]